MEAQMERARNEADALNLAEKKDSEPRNSFKATVAAMTLFAVVAGGMKSEAKAFGGFGERPAAERILSKETVKRHSDSMFEQLEQETARQRERRGSPAIQQEDAFSKESKIQTPERSYNMDELFQALEQKEQEMNSGKTQTGVAEKEQTHAGIELTAEERERAISDAISKIENALAKEKELTKSRMEKTQSFNLRKRQEAQLRSIEIAETALEEVQKNPDAYARVDAGGKVIFQGTVTKNDIETTFTMMVDGEQVAWQASSMDRDAKTKMEELRTLMEQLGIVK